MNRPLLPIPMLVFKSTELLVGREAGERWVAKAWLFSILDLKSGRTTR